MSDSNATIETDHLDTNPTDRAIALTESVASFLPGIGPLLANAVLQDIPGQRLDRLADFLKRLAGEVDELKAAEKIQHAEYAEFVADGASQAAKACSDERREYISKVVAFGLSDDEKQRIEAQRILQLLSQVDDDQIIILLSYLFKNSHDSEFQNKHSAILDPVRSHMNSSREEMDDGLMWQLARSHLVSMGLLNITFRKPKRGELPEFDDNTGSIKAQGKDLSPLGRLLLRRIGLAEVDEF